jgi:alkyl sulfatase BDS1-like metallo-beta-lactamase superfamily hydrolase
MKDIFTKEITDEMIGRINLLNSETQPVWGKMSVGQMLAHVAVTYKYIYDNTYKNQKVLRHF